MTVSREVAASPRKKPAANCLASMGRRARAGGRPSRLPAPREPSIASGSQSSTALAATARGSPSRASAIARNVSPTATMWARYQVDPSWLANQKTVPSPKNTVVARRTVGRIGSRPRTQKATPTTIAPNPTAMSDSLVVRPKTRDERHEHERRQRRERDERPARRRPIRPFDRQDVVEVVVRDAEPISGVDRVLDPGLAIEPRGGLPDEVVVRVPPLGIADGVDDQQQEDDREADGHRGPAGDRVEPRPRLIGRRGTPC